MRFKEEHKTAVENTLKKILPILRNHNIATLEFGTYYYSDTVEEDDNTTSYTHFDERKGSRTQYEWNHFFRDEGVSVDFRSFVLDVETLFGTSGSSFELSVEDGSIQYVADAYLTEPEYERETVSGYAYRFDSVGEITDNLPYYFEHDDANVPYRVELYGWHRFFNHTSRDFIYKFCWGDISTADFAGGKFSIARDTDFMADHPSAKELTFYSFVTIMNPMIAIRIASLATQSCYYLSDRDDNGADLSVGMAFETTDGKDAWKETQTKEAFAARVVDRYDRVIFEIDNTGQVVTDLSTRYCIEYFDAENGGTWIPLQSYEQYPEWNGESIIAEARNVLDNNDYQIVRVRDLIPFMNQVEQKTFEADENDIADQIVEIEISVKNPPENAALKEISKGGLYSLTDYMSRRQAWNDVRNFARRWYGEDARYVELETGQEYDDQYYYNDITDIRAYGESSHEPEGKWGNPFTHEDEIQISYWADAVQEELHESLRGGDIQYYERDRNKQPMIITDDNKTLVGQSLQGYIKEFKYEDVWHQEKGEIAVPDYTTFFDLDKEPELPSWCADNRIFVFVKDSE